MRYSAIITNGHMSCNTAVMSEAPEIAIPKAAAMGYDAVQLTIASPADYDLPALKKLVADNNMTVNALATGRIYSVEHYSMGSDDEENRKTCVARLNELSDVCHELGGAALIIGACRGKTSDAATPRAYHRQFEKSMREVCDYAEKLDVPVILELIDYLESDCCNKLPETLDYLARLNKKNLSMYLDTMHLYYEKEDICGVLREYGASVPQVDISGEERLNPMDSVIDFEVAMKALKESGFDGVLTFELDASKRENLAEDSLKYIKGLMEG